MRCINKWGGPMLTNIIISVISGAIGGNALGGGLTKLNLGGLGNTIAGAVGGLGAGEGLAMLTSPEGAAPLAGMAEAAAGGGIAALLAAAAAGGAGGGVLTGMIAMARRKMGGGE